MARFRYSLNNGVSWTTINAALPFTIPSTASQDVIVEPLGDAVLNEKPPVVISKPVNTTEPVLSGTSKVGQELTLTKGVWSNNPDSYAYRYKADGVVIDGATTSKYTLVNSDVGKNIVGEVLATNAGGTTVAASNSLGPVTLPVTVTSLEPAFYPELISADLVHRIYFPDIHHPTYAGPTWRLVRSTTAGSQDFGCDATTKRFDKQAVDAWAGNEDVKLVGFIDQNGSGEIWNAVGDIYVKKNGVWFDAATSYDEETGNLTRMGQGGACAWLGDSAGHMDGTLTNTSAAQGLEFHYGLTSEERKRAANATDPLGLANNTAEHYFSAGVSNTVKIHHSLQSGGTALHTVSLDLDSASSADSATYSGYILEKYSSAIYSYVMGTAQYQLWENRRACTSRAVPSAHQTALAGGSMDNLKFTVGGVIGSGGVITRTSGANVSLYGLAITKPLTSEQRFIVRERLTLGMMQHRAKTKEQLMSRLDDIVLFRKANPTTGVVVGEKGLINIQLDIAANERGTPNWVFNNLSSYGVRGLYSPDNLNLANSWEETSGFWAGPKQKGTMIAIGDLDPTGSGGTYGSNLSSLFRHTTESRFSSGNVTCSLSLGWDHNAPVMKTGPGNNRGSLSSLISTRKFADKTTFGGSFYDGSLQWGGKYNDKLSPTGINFNEVYNGISYTEAAWANQQPEGFPYLLDAPVYKVNPRNQQILGKVGYMCSMIGTFDNGSILQFATDAEWEAARLTCKTTFYISYGKGIGQAQANYNIKNEMPLVEIPAGSRLKSNHFLQANKGHLFAFAFGSNNWNKVEQEEWAFNEHKFLIAA